MKDKKTKQSASKGISRRDFLRNTSMSTVGVGMVSSGLLQKVTSPSQNPKIQGPGVTSVLLNINAKEYGVRIEPRMTLAEVLRDQLDLTGTKIGCDRGACGACTVMVDGKTFNSCLMLAIEAVGKSVQTIEGLSTDQNKLHPLQQSFIEHDALQCGFCTSGMIMSCKELLDNNKKPAIQDIRSATSGNLCRCGTYPKVFEAVKSVSS